MDKGSATRDNVHVGDRSLAAVGLGLIIGACTWTATEYAAHRWVLHGPFGKGRLAKVPLGGLHRAHHRDPECTSLPARTAGHVAVAASAAVVSVGLAGIAPALIARSAAAAFAGGYSTYEINHWNFHHRPARTARGQRMRDRHHQHHFGAPASNLGVTMTFWDHLFGTEAVSGTAACQDRR